MEKNRPSPVPQYPTRLPPQQPARPPRGIPPARTAPPPPPAPTVIPHVPSEVSSPHLLLGWIAIFDALLRLTQAALNGKVVFGATGAGTVETLAEALVGLSALSGFLSLLGGIFLLSRNRLAIPCILFGSAGGILAQLGDQSMIIRVSVLQHGFHIDGNLLRQLLILGRVTIAPAALFILLAHPKSRRSIKWHL